MGKILEAVHRAGDYHAAKGIGTLITSITMTLFYLIMGIIMVVLFFVKRNDKAYSLMYLAITLSFPLPKCNVLPCLKEKRTLKK